MSLRRPRLPAAVIAAIIVGAVALLAVTAGTASAGAPVFTFNVDLNYSCVSGSAPDNDALSVTLKDPSGHSLGTRAETASSSGYWSDACFNRYVQPGDKLSAVDGSHSRTFTVPGITAYLDRTTDVASGLGPKNSPLSISLYDCGTLQSCTEKGTARTVHSNASGAWHTDWTSTFNVRGDDYVYATWTSPSTDTVDVYTYSPYVVVTLGTSEVTGTVGAGQTGTVTIKNGSTVRGTAHFVGEVPNGEFDSGFLNKHMIQVSPVSGNTVTSSFGASFTLPNLAVSGVASSNMVTGTCPANRPFEVYARDVTYPYRSNDYSYQYGTASNTGHVSVNTTAGSYSSFDLQAADEVTLFCELSSGDEEVINSVVP